MKKQLKNFSVNLLTIGTVPSLGATSYFIFQLLLPAAGIEIPNLEFLSEVIISSATTLSGFIMACLSLFLSFSSSMLMQKIRNQHRIWELTYRYLEPLILGIVVIIYYTLVGTFIPNEIFVSKSICLWGGTLLVSYLISIFMACIYLVVIIKGQRPPKNTISNDPTLP